MKSYLVQEKDNRLQYSETKILDSPASLSILNHPIRLQILKLLAKTPMYPAELAKELKMHEQKIYYHIKQLSNADLLDIVEKQEVRGTVAKKLAPRYLNFSYSLSKDWKDISKLMQEKDSEIQAFLKEFILNGKLNANIVVGSPDPHGPYKARARDGHYAIDMAHFLGNYSGLSDSFATKLDVDINLKQSKNLILVGGPVTNLVVNKVNEFLPAKFSDTKPWGIITNIKTYTEESVGLISKIKNPFNPDYSILVVAGIRFIGTKAAVLAFTRFTKQVINRYTGQKEFYSIVQGFDIDGDGKIDNIEVLE